MLARVKASSLDSVSSGCADPLRLGRLSYPGKGAIVIILAFTSPRITPNIGRLLAATRTALNREDPPQGPSGLSPSRGYNAYPLRE